MDSKHLLFLALVFLCLAPLPLSADEDSTGVPEDLSFLSPNLKVPEGLKPEALELYYRGAFLIESLRKGRVFWGESEKEADHEHVVAVNGRGDGRTDIVAGHFHRVKAGVIGPALDSKTGKELSGEAAHTHGVKSFSMSQSLTSAGTVKPS